MPTVPPAGCDLPRELQLVLHLLRAALGTAGGIGPPRLDAAEVDWGAFTDQVSRHRLAPFLTHRLPAPEKASLPPGVRRALLEGGIVTLNRGAAQAALLGRVLRLLADAGVPALCVKGPVLAQEIYGAVGARHVGDLDLLIAPEDAERADAACRAAGLRRTTPGFDLTPRQQRFYRRLRHEYGYVDPGTGVRVELMWRLADDGLTREVAGEPPRVVELRGERVATLAPQSEALYLLLHGARHGWARLFWLVDVAILLRDGAIDWPGLLSRAERRGGRRSVLLGVHLAHRLLGAPLPEGVRAPMPRSVLALAPDACRQIAGPLYAQQRGAPFLRRALFMVRRHDRWHARAGELRRWLVAASDWETLPLPDRWFGLYYLAGPVLRARDLLRRLGGRGRRAGVPPRASPP